MSLITFLKPTITKIIVAILILVIFVPFIHYDTGIRCIQAPCPAGADGSIAMWLIFSHNFYVYSVSYVNLIIGVFLSYLVSCLVIFGIDKIKRK